MRYFDYESVAREAGIPAEKLEAWRESLRRDYPGDEMMVELRLLRACEAVRQQASTADAISEALGCALTPSLDS